MAVLVIAEHDNTNLRACNLATLAAAEALKAGEITMLVMGSKCQQVAEAAAACVGVTKVLVYDAPHYGHFLAEELTVPITEQAKDYSHILAPATSFGKNLLPRVAASLDVMQISEISAVETADIFQRPIYAGNAIVTVQSNDPIKVITVRTTAFEAVAESGGSAIIENHETTPKVGLSCFVNQQLSGNERPELTSARIVISGGRGMQSGENFALLDSVADKLGAAVGASRAAVDAGFVPNDYQVGQTGKVVAPDLYIAVGISGAIQHLAGMKDSKIIVAINKDEDAPIFQVADYGLVTDLFQAVPELDQALD